MLRTAGFILVQILFLYFLNQSVSLLRPVEDVVANTVDFIFSLSRVSLLSFAVQSGAAS